MERRVILMLVIATSLCGCGGESKTPDQPTVSARAKAAVAPPPAKSTVAPLPAEATAARPPAAEPPSDASGEKSALGDYVSFPALGLKIRQPEGFRKG